VASLEDILRNVQQDKSGFASDTRTSSVVTRSDWLKNAFSQSMQQGATVSSPPKAPQPTGLKGFVFDVLNNPIVKPIINAVDVLAIPGRAVTSGLQEFMDAYDQNPNTRATFSDFRKQVDDPTFGFGRVIGDYTGNKWVDRVIGFAGDVVLDPLTYLTLGTTKALTSGQRLARPVSSAEGRFALASKLFELGADPEVVKAVARRGRSAVKNPDLLAKAGYNRAGVYWMGKRIPGTTRAGERAEAMFTGFRVWSGDHIFKRVGDLFTPQDMLNLRRQIARGDVPTEDVNDFIGMILSRNEERAVEAAAGREVKALRRTNLGGVSAEDIAVSRGEVYKLMEKPIVVDEQIISGVPTTNLGRAQVRSSKAQKAARDLLKDNPDALRALGVVEEELSGVLGRSVGANVSDAAALAALRENDEVRLSWYNTLTGIYEDILKGVDPEDALKNNLSKLNIPEDIRLAIPERVNTLRNLPVDYQGRVAVKPTRQLTPEEFDSIYSRSSPGKVFDETTPHGRVAAAVSAHFKDMHERILAAGKAVDPEFSIGEISNYVPHMPTDKAWRWMADTNNPAATTVKDTLFNPFTNTGSYKHRMAEGDKIGSYVLTQADINGGIARLNNIYRQEFKVNFNFFETDLPTILDKYDRMYAGMMGKIARKKYLVDRGIYQRVEPRLIADPEINKVAQKKIKSVNDMRSKAAKNAAKKVDESAESIRNIFDAEIGRVQAQIDEIGRPIGKALMDEGNLVYAQQKLVRDLASARADLYEAHNAFHRNLDEAARTPLVQALDRQMGSLLERLDSLADEVNLLDFKDASIKQNLQPVLDRLKTLGKDIERAEKVEARIITVGNIMSEHFEAILNGTEVEGAKVVGRKMRNSYGAKVKPDVAAKKMIDRAVDQPWWREIQSVLPIAPSKVQRYAQRKNIKTKLQELARSAGQRGDFGDTSALEEMRAMGAALVSWIDTMPDDIAPLFGELKDDLVEAIVMAGRSSGYYKKLASKRAKSRGVITVQNIVDNFRDVSNGVTETLGQYFAAQSLRNRVFSAVDLSTSADELVPGSVLARIIEDPEFSSLSPYLERYVDDTVESVDSFDQIQQLMQPGEMGSARRADSISYGELEQILNRVVNDSQTKTFDLTLRTGSVLDSKLDIPFDVDRNGVVRINISEYIARAVELAGDDKVTREILDEVYDDFFLDAYKPWWESFKQVTGSQRGRVEFDLYPRSTRVAIGGRGQRSPLREAERRKVQTGQQSAEQAKQNLQKKTMELMAAVDDELRPGEVLSAEDAYDRLNNLLLQTYFKTEIEYRFSSLTRQMLTEGLVPDKDLYRLVVNTVAKELSDHSMAQVASYSYATSKLDEILDVIDGASVERSRLREIIKDPYVEAIVKIEAQKQLDAIPSAGYWLGREEELYNTVVKMLSAEGRSMELDWRTVVGEANGIHHAHSLHAELKALGGAQQQSGVTNRLRKLRQQYKAATDSLDRQRIKQDIDAIEASMPAIKKARRELLEKRLRPWYKKNVDPSSTAPTFIEIELALKDRIKINKAGGRLEPTATVNEIRTWVQVAAKNISENSRRANRNFRWTLAASDPFLDVSKFEPGINNLQDLPLIHAASLRSAAQQLEDDAGELASARMAVDRTMPVVESAEEQAALAERELRELTRKGGRIKGLVPDEEVEVMRRARQISDRIVELKNTTNYLGAVERSELNELIMEMAKYSVRQDYPLDYMLDPGRIASGLIEDGVLVFQKKTSADPDELLKINEIKSQINALEKSLTARKDAAVRSVSAVDDRKNGVTQRQINELKRQLEKLTERNPLGSEKYREVLEASSTKKGVVYFRFREGSRFRTVNDVVEQQKRIAKAIKNGDEQLKNSLQIELDRAMVPIASQEKTLTLNGRRLTLNEDLFRGLFDDVNERIVDVTDEGAVRQFTLQQVALQRMSDILQAIKAGEFSKEDFIDALRHTSSRRQSELYHTYPEAHTSRVAALEEAWGKSGDKKILDEIGELEAEESLTRYRALLTDREKVIDQARRLREESRRVTGQVGERGAPYGYEKYSAGKFQTFYAEELEKIRVEEYERLLPKYGKSRAAEMAEQAARRRKKEASYAAARRAERIPNVEPTVGLEGAQFRFDRSMKKVNDIFDNIKRTTNNQYDPYQRFIEITSDGTSISDAMRIIVRELEQVRPDDQTFVKLAESIEPAVERAEALRMQLRFLESNIPDELFARYLYGSSGLSGDLVFPVTAHERRLEMQGLGDTLAKLEKERVSMMRSASREQRMVDVGEPPRGSGGRRAILEGGDGGPSPVEMVQSAVDSGAKRSKAMDPSFKQVSATLRESSKKVAQLQKTLEGMSSLIDDAAIFRMSTQDQYARVVPELRERLDNLIASRDRIAQIVAGNPAAEQKYSELLLFQGEVEELLKELGTIKSGGSDLIVNADSAINPPGFPPLPGTVVADGTPKLTKEYEKYLLVKAQFLNAWHEYNIVDKFQAEALSTMEDLKDLKWGTMVDETLKKGWTTLEELGLPSYQATTQLLEISKNMERMIQPEFVRGLNRFIGSYTGFVKSYLTASPGFVVRNTMGNTFMLVAAGAELENLSKGIKLYRAWMESIKDGLEQQFIDRLPQRERDLFEQAVRASDASGYGKAQDAVAGWQPKRQVLKDNKYTMLFRNMNNASEGSARFMLAYDSVAKGMDFNMATARVKKYLFDYVDVGSADEALRTIVPFWFWMSRNLPMQIANRWTNPRAYLMYDKLMKNLRNNEDDQYLPSWMVTSGAVRLTDDLYLNMDLGFNRIDEELQMLGDPAKLLGKLNPAIKVPAEVLFNKRLGYNSDFDDEGVQAPGSLLSPAVQALASLLGQSRETESGGRGVSEKFSYALQSILPPLAQSERLLPATEGGKERQGNALLGYLGVPLRNVSEEDRQREMLRQRYLMQNQ
jgi:hypothetical protein